MTLMTMMVVTKVTLEGAFDVFLELCREYWGQLRSHLNKMMMMMMLLMMMTITMTMAMTMMTVLMTMTMMIVMNAGDS